MFCTRCGTKAEDGALFCSNCGAKMLENQLYGCALAVILQQEIPRLPGTESVGNLLPAGGKIRMNIIIQSLGQTIETIRKGFSGAYAQMRLSIKSCKVL